MKRLLLCMLLVFAYSSITLAMKNQQNEPDQKNTGVTKQFTPEELQQIRQVIEDKTSFNTYLNNIRIKYRKN